MIEAYFDESEQRDGTFSVAGYCYFPAEAKKIKRKWLRILDGRPFHATDMNAGKGDFKDLDKPTSCKMYEDLISAVVKHAAFGIAMSVNPREVTAKWPELDGFRTAYALCCYMVVYRIATYLDDHGIKSRIAFVFESGHNHQNEAERVMELVSKSEERSNRVHYLSHTFIPKKDMPLLWTADLLAWEWAKCSSETGFPTQKVNAKRDVRKSLEVLLKTQPDKACVGHFTGSQLDEFLVACPICFESGDTMRGIGVLPLDGLGLPVVEPNVAHQFLG